MKRIEHREAAWKFPFVEYVPEESGGRLPLIIQLHGAGERGNGGEELAAVDVHGLSKLMHGASYPCRFVMPQCPRDTFWAARVESLVAFVEQLKAAFEVDEDRVYLTGLSMGGFGTWFVAMARPDLFAAIAPICGGGMAWNAEVLNMPIRVFHGAEDTVVAPFHSDNMVEKLRELGKDVSYTRLEGVGHNAWDYAYSDELIRWMLSKKR
jgi:predicted peptidase